MLTASSRWAQRVLIAFIGLWVFAALLSVVPNPAIQSLAEQAYRVVVSGLMHCFWLLPVFFAVVQLHQEFPIFQRDLVGDLTTSTDAWRHIWIYGGYFLTFVAWLAGFLLPDAGPLLLMLACLTIGGLWNLILGFFLPGHLRRTVVISGIVCLFLAAGLLCVVFLVARNFGLWLEALMSMKQYHN